MKIPSINLSVGQNRYNRFPFQSTHHTTSCFGEFRPIFYRPLQVGDKLTVLVSDMIRTEPLIYPTYGEVVHKLHAFFVPYRILYPHFKDFIEGTKFVRGHLYVSPNLPTFTPSLMRTIFTTTSNGLMVEVGSVARYEEIRDLRDSDGEPVGVDVALGASGSGVVCYKFTRLGRAWLKIFNSLGYTWNWSLSTGNTTSEVSFNALALLSFFQVYLDYFCPSDYVSTHPFNRLIEQVKLSYSGSADVDSWQSYLIDCMKQIKLAYDLDYFTSAWEKFNAPVESATNDLNSTLTVDVPSSYGSSAQYTHSIRNTDNGTYLGRKDSPGNTGVMYSSVGIKMLEQLANFVNRSHFAGARPVEKLLARFGIKVPEYTMDRCVYLGSSRHQIQISDLQNLAESEYAQLGNYAGRMIGASTNQKFHCEAKEYGMFMIVATIMPKIDYFQGYDRFNAISDRFEFYTPEFAKISNDAIHVGELYADFSVNSYDFSAAHNVIGDEADVDSRLSDSNINNLDVFGYMQRYAHFKVGRSFVTGDYRVGSLKSVMEPFHLNRILIPKDQIRAKGSFLYVDASQYDRIFNVKSDKIDQFYPIYYFDCNLESKMEAFGNSTPITDGQGSVSVDMGGTELN